MVRKQNFSRKRQAILEVLRSTKIHPTAEWVHQTLKSDYPDLSLGTVYRNLAPVSYTHLDVYKRQAVDDRNIKE